VFKISVLVLKVSHSECWLFQPIFRHMDPDPDSEYGSGSESRIQAQFECDQTGSGSETLATGHFLTVAAEHNLGLPR
jgi:hypothetical protein